MSTLTRVLAAVAGAAALVPAAAHGEPPTDRRAGPPAGVPVQVAPPAGRPVEVVPPARAPAAPTAPAVAALPAVLPTGEPHPGAARVPAAPGDERPAAAAHAGDGEPVAVTDEEDQADETDETDEADDIDEADEADAAPVRPVVGPKASAKAKAKAYGVACRGVSRKRVAGQKGTQFSRCVTALARVAAGETRSPKVACQGLSRKRVAGERHTG